MKIIIQELIHTIIYILDNIQDIEPEITITEDYYWRLVSEKTYDMSNILNEQDFTIGSLVDDLNELLKIKDNEKYVPIKYDLNRVCALLTFIANKE